MCTSRGERKILTLVALPRNGESPATLATLTTLPSAGETTKPSAAGAWRSGSRKNAATARAISPRIIPSGIQPARNASSAMIPTAKISGYPSLAILIGSTSLASASENGQNVQAVPIVQDSRYDSFGQFANRSLSALISSYSYRPVDSVQATASCPAARLQLFPTDGSRLPFSAPCNGACRSGIR